MQKEFDFIESVVKSEGNNIHPNLKYYFNLNYMEFEKLHKWFKEHYQNCIFNCENLTYIFDIGKNGIDKYVRCGCDVEIQLND